MKHFYLPYFLVFIVHPFKRGIKVTGYRRHSKSNTHCTFDGIVSRRGILKLDPV